MKHFALLAALLCSSLLPGCQSAAPRPASGLAAVRIDVVAEPKAGARTYSAPVRVYDKPAARPMGAFEQVDYAALDDVVIWLEPANGAAASPSGAVPSATVTFDAAKETRTLDGIVSVGQRLTLRNAGASAATPYSVSDGNAFNLGSIPPGATGEYTVQSAGPIEVLCDPSKEPAAIVYAAPTRWAAKGRSGGHVSFTDLPPGTYRIVSWHPRLPGDQSTVTLAPNQSATAFVKVGVNALPKEGSQ